ncbi:MAG: hypothetical protein ABFR82_05285 [Nitrospirota bacterium]
MASFSRDYLIKKSDTAEKDASGQETALKHAADADLDLLLMIINKRINRLPIIHIHEGEA